MNWGDVLFGIGIGVMLTCVSTVVVIIVGAVFSDLFARIGKLEDASREEGRDEAENLS